MYPAELIDPPDSPRTPTIATSIGRCSVAFGRGSDHAQTGRGRWRTPNSVVTCQRPPIVGSALPILVRKGWISRGLSEPINRPRQRVTFFPMIARVDIGLPTRCTDIPRWDSISMIVVRERVHALGQQRVCAPKTNAE
jgi:hypothetical protein